MSGNYKLSYIDVAHRIAKRHRLKFLVDYSGSLYRPGLRLSKDPNSEYGEKSAPSWKKKIIQRVICENKRAYRGLDSADANKAMLIFSNHYCSLDAIDDFEEMFPDLGGEFEEKSWGYTNVRLYTNGADGIAKELQFLTPPEKVAYDITRQLLQKIKELDPFNKEEYMKKRKLLERAIKYIYRALAESSTKVSLANDPKLKSKIINRLIKLNKKFPNGEFVPYNLQVMQKDIPRSDIEILKEFPGNHIMHNGNLRPTFEPLVDEQSELLQKYSRLPQLKFNGILYTYVKTSKKF